MDISSEYITDYLLKKFNNKNYKISNRELLVESIFVQNDFKKHMSINLDTGLWQCFKSGEKGSFIYLYSKLEGVPYKKAYNTFLVEAFFNPIEPIKIPEEKPESIDELFNSFVKVDIQDVDIVYSPDIKLPEMIHNTEWMALQYLRSRKIEFESDYYYDPSGKYANRVIIPFLNKGKEPFFFQARLLPNVRGYNLQRYLNPKNVKFSNILYPFDLESSEPLFITEGVINTLSIAKACKNRTSVGSCNVSTQQMNQLKLYRGKLVFAFDNDTAGLKGLLNAERIRRRLRMPPIYYTLPIMGMDWNDMLVKHGYNLITETLYNFKEFDAFEYIINSELDTLDS